jgi:hypothetical protein
MTMSIEQRNRLAQRNTAHSQERSMGMVSDYPISSVLVVFGVGIWAGVALGQLLIGPAAPPTLGRRTELAAEQLGRQMLGAIAGVLPASLAKHIAV